MLTNRFDRERPSPQCRNRGFRETSSARASFQIYQRFNHGPASAGNFFECRMKRITDTSNHACRAECSRTERLRKGVLVGVLCVPPVRHAAALEYLKNRIDLDFGQLFYLIASVKIVDPQLCSATSSRDPHLRWIVHGVLVRCGQSIQKTLEKFTQLLAVDALLRPVQKLQKRALNGRSVPVSDVVTGCGGRSCDQYVALFLPLSNLFHGRVERNGVGRDFLAAVVQSRE